MTSKQEQSPVTHVFSIVREAKKSLQLSRILSAYKAAERSELSSSLIPTSFHGISTLYSQVPAGGEVLKGEIIWGSIVISKSADVLKKYLSFKNGVQALILESNWRGAADLIAAFELAHGASVVTKELAIAVQQQSEGTIRQVAFSRRLQSLSGSGAVGNFLHFCSERNEDRLALSSMRRNFRENYSASQINPLVSAILHWHALRQLPRDQELLARLLDYECTGSIFDYFEVYVVAVVSLAFSGDPEQKQTLINSLRRIVLLGDRRLTNALAIAEQKLSPTPNEGGRSLYMVLTSFAGSRDRSNPKDEQRPIREVIESFSLQKDFSTATRRLVHKYGVNFYFLDYFQAVFGHLEHKASAACFDHTVSPLVAAQFPSQSIDLLLACSRRVILKSKYAGHFVVDKIDDPSRDSEARLAAAIGLLEERDVDSLIGIMSNAENLNALDKTHLLLLVIRACILSKRYVELLPFAFVLSEIRLDALLMLQLIPVLEQIYPKRLDQRESTIFSVVAARLLLLEDSDWIEDKLMVATECALQNLDVAPDWYFNDLMHRNVWVAFLNEVMETQNVLLIDGVDSLRQALDLRLRVLRQLIELDPDSKDDYQEEVRDITFNLSVEDGTKHVNTSRLYVNVQGLQKWAIEHCKDDFERYKELVMGEAVGGALFSKAVVSGGSLLEQIASIPLGAADDQLLTLLFRIRTAYLSDPRNGLDAFISLRVRHGSLAGTLSRGLDTRQLLLLKKGDRGSYEIPAFWIEQLKVQDSQRSDLISAFARFTTKFHSSIDELLRNRLRVRSEGSPDGMITADVTDIFLKGMKHDIVNDLSFDAFLGSVFLTYKNSVSQYLAGLRDHLKGDFLRLSVENLQTLSEEIEAAIGPTELLTKVHDAITSARIDLQSSVKIVCGWLEIAQKDDLSQIFTLQQATQIGINYTRQVRQDFSPDLRISGDDLELVRLTGASLIAIVDILFILLDNVYKHAGEPNYRQISLEFDLAEEGVIKIRMTNDLAPSKDLVEIAGRLLAAKKLLIDGESERKLTEEEKSGIPKLSRLVMQDRPDALSFKLDGGNVMFTVLVGYASLGVAQ